MANLEIVIPFTCWALKLILNGLKYDLKSVQQQQIVLFVQQAIDNVRLLDTLE